MKLRKHTKTLLKVYREMKATGLRNEEIAEKMAAAGYKRQNGEPVSWTTIRHLSKVSHRMRAPSVRKEAAKTAQSDVNEIATLILSSKMSDELKLKALKAIYA